MLKRFCFDFCQIVLRKKNIKKFVCLVFEKAKLVPVYVYKHLYITDYYDYRREELMETNNTVWQKPPNGEISSFSLFER